MYRRRTHALLLRPLFVGLLAVSMIIGSLLSDAPIAEARTASISVSPASAAPGTTVRIQGDAFGKKDLGAILFGSVEVAEFSANGAGKFSLSVVVPPAPTGDLTVTARGQATSATDAFSVLAPADDGPPETPTTPPTEPEPPVEDPPAEDPPAEDPPAEDPPEPETSGALTWSPPAGWENYREVVLPATGGTLDLASDVDYRISAPVTRTEALHIRGGRNIVWIGGHIRIADQPAFASGTSRRGLVVSDATNGSSVDGRIIHIEGLLIDGNDLSEGINTNAPSAIFQLQNIRVELVKIRGADDRDGTGGYPGRSHPDIIQLWGSKKELRVDGLTGRSNYQGLFLNEDTAARRLGPNYFRRVNVELVETLGEDGHRYAGHRGYTWTPGSSGRQFIDNGTVWLQHHRNSGWTSSGSYRRVAYRDSSGKLVSEPVLGTSAFGDNLHPAVRNHSPYTLNVASDALGTFGSWSDSATVDVAPGVPAVRDFSGQEAGRIYAGRPPGGDYVPASTVGRSYRSPGYR